MGTPSKSRILDPTPDLLRLRLGTSGAFCQTLQVVLMHENILKSSGLEIFLRVPTRFQNL